MYPIKLSVYSFTESTDGIDGFSIDCQKLPNKYGT